MNKNFIQRFGIPPRYTLGTKCVLGPPNFIPIDKPTMIKRKFGEYLSFKSVKRLIMSIQNILLTKAMIEIVYEALDKYSYHMNDPDIDCRIRFIKHRLNRQSIRHADIKREWANEK